MRQELIKYESLAMDIIGALLCLGGDKPNADLFYKDGILTINLWETGESVVYNCKTKKFFIP